MINNKYKERLRFLEETKKMLDWGLLKEKELITELELPEYLIEELLNESENTHEKATKKLQEEINKVTDLFYESEEMEALQKEAEDKGAEIWNNER